MLEVDAYQRTTIDGVYAGGEVVSDLHQIAVATGHAAVAATHIHNSLLGNYKGLGGVPFRETARQHVAFPIGFFLAKFIFRSNVWSPTTGGIFVATFPTCVGRFLPWILGWLDAAVPAGTIGHVVRSNDPSSSSGMNRPGGI
jgi:hypothetical protein